MYSIKAFCSLCSCGDTIIIKTKTNDQFHSLVCLNILRNL